MSDLAATNCNTGCGCQEREGGCSCIIWILLLLYHAMSRGPIFRVNGNFAYEGQKGAQIEFLFFRRVITLGKYLRSTCEKYLF